MKVIAETKDGYLVHATENEIKEILSSVTGKRPEQIEIGQKIPALDYASTITKTRTLQDNFEVKRLFLYTERAYDSIKDLEKAIIAANNVES